MPQEPPPTRWVLPDVDRLPDELQDEDLVGFGGDLEPGTLLAAYRTGLFPMHVPIREEDGEQPELLEIGWWSPEPRGILPLDGLVISRSLRRSCRRMSTTVDKAFSTVVDRCADTREDGQWINDSIKSAYCELHDLGWAHSIETWQDGELVGGLYGVSIGGLFAGESMFHSATDASKVALVRLVEDLAADGADRLLDVQWVTPHLASLGAIAIPRQEYLERLAAALRLPPPAAWSCT
ncbi:MAG TPA: leucyl/phenylalanyl-tRNA--protein transferase [Actinomycetes bacterium]|nr:leucyl/phenylalanyl-tRNA--protein transferase [Actinomycetes bacterium]